MIHSINEIFEGYDNLVRDCYRETGQRMSLLNRNCFVRQESSQIKEENTLFYFIQLVSGDRIKEDDYGVSVDIELIGDQEWMVCQVDVLKTNGLLYSENFFSLIQNDLINTDEYNRSVDFIRSLPEVAVDIFIRDYLQT